MSGEVWSSAGLGYPYEVSSDGRSDNRVENLRYGTRSDNVRDSIRHGTNINAAKTHCLRGHEFSESNTHYRPRGGRVCLRCNRGDY